MTQRKVADAAAQRRTVPNLGLASSEKSPPPIRVGSVLAALALTPPQLRHAGESPTERYPVVGKQLRLIEVCAGHAGITAAWRAQGYKAGDPIELYGDVDTQSEPRLHHDVSLPVVQERLLSLAADPEGPNLWLLEPSPAPASAIGRSSIMARAHSPASKEEPAARPTRRRKRWGTHLGDSSRA